MNSDTPCKVTLDELKRGALEHYEDISTKAHHWNSLVPKAIEAYNPDALEHIKNQSILFAEFIADNYPEYTRMPSGSWIAYSGHAYTTQELYDLFIKKTQK